MGVCLLFSSKQHYLRLSPLPLIFDHHDDCDDDDDDDYDDPDGGLAKY